ncbi:MAG: hypothetical protein V1846_04280 [Candidatus Komeilibacteria bacterium]
MYETQYQQDIETLKGLLETIDTRKLGEEVMRLRAEVGTSSKTNDHKEGILKTLELLQKLTAFQEWDDAIGRYVRNNLGEIAAVAGVAENLDDSISNAVVVAARAVERLAEARFPEIVKKFSNDRTMSQEEVETAKKNAGQIKVS